MTRRPSYYGPCEWPSVEIIEPPMAIVSLDEVKRQCGETTTDNDVQIDELILRAQAEIEPTDSWIGRSFGLQTLEAKIAAWTAYDIPLPFPPVREIVSVKYDDKNGVERTLGSGTYRLLGVGGISPRLSLVSGQAWPAVLAGDEVIRIRYVAGYDEDDPRLLPAKQAVAMMTGQMFHARGDGSSLRRVDVPGVLSREWFLSDATRTAVDETARRLLSRYQIWPA
jgi:uncharacterized phiE125 gp8 family phage protein